VTDARQTRWKSSPLRYAILVLPVGYLAYDAGFARHWVDERVRVIVDLPVPHTAAAAQVHIEYWDKDELLREADLSADATEPEGNPLAFAHQAKLPSGGVRIRATYTGCAPSERSVEVHGGTTTVRIGACQKSP
jgi:hypothetical protein